MGGLTKKMVFDQNQGMRSGGLLATKPIPGQVDGAHGDEIVNLGSIVLPVQNLVDGVSDRPLITINKKEPVCEAESRYSEGGNHSNVTSVSFNSLGKKRRLHKMKYRNNRTPELCNFLVSLPGEYEERGLKNRSPGRHERNERSISYDWFMQLGRI